MKRIYSIYLLSLVIGCTPLEDSERTVPQRPVAADSGDTMADLGTSTDATNDPKDSGGAAIDLGTMDSSTIDDAGEPAPDVGMDDATNPMTDASDSDAAEPDAAVPDTVPGGKTNYSVVVSNFDTTGTTWARHANFTFDASGTVASTHWHWESSLKKGKTQYTSHRCTFDNVTRDCFTYTPTGWVYPSRQYFNRSGTFALTDNDSTVEISWNDGQQETWSIHETSTPGLRRLAFVSSNYGITHGKGYGSNAPWTTFRTLQEIVNAGGLKRWDGQMALAASADGSTITTRDWRSTSVDLSSFHSSSRSSAGYTLHAMLPHSANVCKGGCSGSRTGYIMYHLASTNTGRQMVYNNWCTCLSIGMEWPCYNRNMHPLAFHSIIDDSGAHRGWLYVEQQNQPTYTGYQYQIGDFMDL